jgi:uncharacterized protein YbjT (DUF2867 family)
MTQPKSIFVTGASGFIGWHTMRLFSDTSKWQLRLLLREGSKPPAGISVAEIIRGDLGRPDSYREALTDVYGVLHMAAPKGSASATEQDRTGRQASADLVAASSAAGVSRFLFVSSIAAGYADQAFYHYGRSKKLAELAVEGGEIPYCILRPTLVLGDGSPIWQLLGTLAGLPVIPLPTRHRPARVQPVDVEDVAKGIYRVFDSDRFDNELLELGGKDVVDFDSFLLSIAEARFARKPKIFRIPVRLVQYPLALVEPLLRPLMPATAGQFAVFANDSDVKSNWLTEELSAESASLSRTIERLSRGKDKGISPEKTETDAQLRQDAHAYARALSSGSIGDTTACHFVAACKVHGLGRVPETASERALMILSRKGSVGAWLADGYAGIMDRDGLLRRRLVVLSAILEHSPESHMRYDAPKIRRPLTMIFRIVFLGTTAVLQLILGLVAFALFRILRFQFPARHR